MHLDVNIEVDPFSSVSAAHEVEENVRRAILESHPEVAEVFIHIEGIMGYHLPAAYSFLGSLAPEYAMLGQLTKKADVYNFGVLILEIISGESSNIAAFGEDLLVLVESAWQLKEEERLLDLVDLELKEYPAAEMLRFIKVALFCTEAASNQRPSTKQVLEMLSKEVNLYEKLLTEAGVYRCYTSQQRQEAE